jgi:hypothetical protein
MSDPLHEDFFFHIFDNDRYSATINGIHCCGSNKTLSMFVLLTITTFSETLLILTRIHGDAIINVHRSSCIVPVVLVRFS